MERSAFSNVDSDESLLDISTAPTTPDGSLTFSPVLQALWLQDAIESASLGKDRQRQNGSSPGGVSQASNPKVRNICCVGAGYVGGPTAAVMAYQNPSLKVTVVDRDPNRIRQWQSKHPPIYEPGLHEILRIARDGSKSCSFFNEQVQPDFLDSVSSASSSLSECESQCVESREVFIRSRAPNLFFSTEISKSISEADIVLVAVNTPTKSRGLGAGKATDVTALEAVTREIAVHAKPGAILVEKSTVPCRTAELIQETLKIHRPNTPFEVLSNPEFLAAGTAINDLLTPDRVVIGSSDTPSGRLAASALASVYAAWVPRERIVTMNNWSSELSKLVANSMLAQRISSINSVSALCEKTGADIEEVSRAIGHDPRIGNKYLKAGIGFGGSCFKKDVLSLIYLAESLELNEVADYWAQVLKVNEWQRERFVRRVIKCLNGTLVGKKLTILGYAFKKDTNDTRESPALECIKALLEDAPAEIAVFDPCCEPAIVTEEIERLVGGNALRQNGGPVMVYTDPYQSCHQSHAILILTDCDEFKTGDGKNSPNLALKTSKKPSTADPRPFDRLEPTESEVLSLHKFLGSTLCTIDPLRRFEEEPDCKSGCCSCEADKAKFEALQGTLTKERLDWARIAYHLEKPKWIFDGRGVLDVKDMDAFGVRVESIGKVGWGGR